MSAIIDFPDRRPPQGGEAVSFLVTDLDGRATPLAGRADIIAAAVAANDALVRAVATAQGGHVFKGDFPSGDTHIFAAFGATAPAVAAALEIQRRAAASALRSAGGISIRAAIHSGTDDQIGAFHAGATLDRAIRLVAAGHGEQVLLSAAAARSVGPAGLSDGATIERLGRFRLCDLLAPETIHQLRHPALRSDFPPLRTLDRTPNNLPVLDTFYLGHARDLARLNTMLDDQRTLVTVVGPAGVGKTRLALQSGAERSARYPDGVWFVELAPLREAGQIAETICTLLSLKFGGDRTASDMLPRVLRHKRLMIVLDNCEHLRGAVEAVAGEILLACPEVTLVATSRLAIGIAGERCLMLGGHRLPDGDAPLSVSGAMATPAIRLFCARAQQAVPEFVLDDANVATVAAICRRLGGVALAIELTAARLRTMSLDEIQRALRARENTDVLDNAIEGTYELLTPDEAMAFARLAAFGGWFNLDAAACAIGMSPLRPVMVPALVARLLDKSLIARAPGFETETRYRLVDTIRLYAAGKFRADAARDEIMERLCDWLIGHYGESERSWPTTRTDEWLAHYRTDLDNLRAALGWAFGPGGNPASGLQLMSLTSELWRDIGMTVEQRLWLREAETRISPSTPDRVAARIGLDIAFTYGGGAFGDKRHVDSAIDALARYRHIGATEDIAFAAARIAVCVANPEDPTVAQPYVDLIEAGLAAIGRNRRRAFLLNILAALVHFAGDVARAILLLDEVVAISREFNDSVNRQMAGLNLAEILFANGERERAATEAQAVAASCRETGNLLDLGFVLGNIAAYALVRGDAVTGRLTLTEAVPLVADINIEFVLGSCLQSTALFAAQRGDFVIAARLAGFTEQFYERIAIARESTENAVFTALVACLDQAAATDQGFADDRARLMAEGKGWTTKAAVEAAQTALIA